MIAWVTLSDSRGSRSTALKAGRSLSCALSIGLTYHGDHVPIDDRLHLPAMDSLNASATLRWEGYHGTIEGG